MSKKHGDPLGSAIGRYCGGRAEASYNFHNLGNANLTGRFIQEHSGCSSANLRINVLDTGKTLFAVYVSMDNGSAEAAPFSNP